KRMTASCNTGAQLENTTGITDAAGCISALKASCEAFLNFGNQMPAACKPLKGKAVSKPDAEGGGDACVASAQCDSLYCYPNLVTAGCPGKCEPPSAIGEECGDPPAGSDIFNVKDYFCDNINGQHCVGKYSDTDKGFEKSNPTCETVTYGKQGDACYDFGPA